MSQYGIQAIPTKYNGIQFRSRLEAKWAAFFDLVGWRYEYEPFDLDGYIPDFVMVQFRDPVLVEVKPVIKWGEFESYHNKLIASGWEYDILLVGTRIFFPQDPDTHASWFDFRIVGDLYDAAWRTWGSGIIFACNERERHAVFNSAGLTSGEGSYHCRICGEYDGRIPGGVYVAERVWKEAGNRVQYQRKQEERGIVPFEDFGMGARDKLLLETLRIQRNREEE